MINKREYEQLIRPVDYKPLLNVRQTEQGIKMIKRLFSAESFNGASLRRVTAPLFVLKGLGINDDLNGTERPVTFPIKDLGDAQAEVSTLLPSGSGSPWQSMPLSRAMASTPT